MMRFLFRSLLLLTVVATSACVSVPFDYPKDSSEAVTPSSETLLGREAATWSEAHDDMSGFLPLTGGMDALGARLHLMDQAEVSIDAQYFLIKPDQAGLLFANALLDAADRGVKVRFLIDDVFTPNLDSPLTLLSSHPNVEVRLFNPLSRQSFRYWSMFADFSRANRRMHNKSFIVDNSFTIIGGRNIAAEYFQIDEGVEFVDFEVVGLGPIAQAVSAEFDLFWNNELSVPIEAFGESTGDDSLKKWRNDLPQDLVDTSQSVYHAAVTSPYLMNILEDFVTPVPSEADIVTDSPKKLTSEVGDEHYQELALELRKYGDAATKEIFIITPYFVPQKSGAELLESYASRGVRVRVLTNSLASNNHVSVHSGYARYRKRLLEAGVELYELKADSVIVLDDGTQEELQATLHTKALIFDRETLFVGSLNLDPRSIDINTEMGVFLHSPEIASAFAELIDEDLPINSYSVTLDDGKLVWRHGQGDTAEVVTKEPQSGFWRRFSSGFYGILPIEGQL